MPPVFHYLWQPNGTAKCNGYSNVVTHPEVDGMDAASHVDHLLQGFTLSHGRKRGEKVQLKSRKLTDKYFSYSASVTLKVYLMVLRNLLGSLEIVVSLKNVRAEQNKPNVFALSLIDCNNIPLEK